MPVAVGMYLPFGLTSAILVGGLLAWISGRGAPSADARRRGHERGVILASGLIAGEAIAGVLIALPAVFEMQIPAVFANAVILTTIAVVAMVGLCAWIVGTSRPRAD